MEQVSDDLRPRSCYYSDDADNLHEHLFSNCNSYEEFSLERETNKEEYTIFEYVHVSCGYPHNAAYIKFSLIDGDEVFVFFNEKKLNPWDFADSLLQRCKSLINYVSINSETLIMEFQVDSRIHTGN